MPACPAAVAQSARSVATLFRRIIVAIGPASTTDEGAALWRRNIAASASLVAAPASLFAGSARVPVEGARAPARRAALCVWAARVLPRRRRGRGAARGGRGPFGHELSRRPRPQLWEAARPPAARRAAVCRPPACIRRCGGAAAQASAAAVLEAIAWAAPPPRCRAVRAAPLRMWPRNGSLRRLSASVRVCVATGAKYHASADEEAG